MKKLVFLLFSLLFAVISFGQDITVNGVEAGFDQHFDINKNVTYVYFYGDESSDVMIKSETWVRDYSIENFYDALKQECRVEIDSISGAPNVVVTLSGKYSYNDSYTSIATAVWHGNGQDTTIILKGSTAKAYRFLKFSAATNSTTQSVQIERVEVGVYK